MASVPEPPPKDEGKSVTTELIRYARDLDPTEYSLPTRKFIDLIKARELYGIQKYGQTLKTKDGRNTVEDALQELGDLCQYLFKARLNKEDITKVKELLLYVDIIANMEDDEIEHHLR